MAERRGVKRDCSFLSAEHPLGTGTFHVLKRDLGDDYAYEIMHLLKGVMINQPGLVAAIGGIPDELKIKDGISFSYPSPTFKIPKILPEDPTECYTTNALSKAYSEAVLRLSKKSDKDEPQDNMINEQQPPNPSLLEVVSKELMKEGGLHNLRNQQLPPSMIEVNVVVPPPAGHPIPTNSQPASKWGDYRLCRLKTRSQGYIHEFLRRDHSDGSMEIVLLKGLLVNKPGVVVAVGGIPDDLKIEGAISFSFPYPVFKLPSRMPLDPTEQQAAVYEYQKEGVLKYGTKKAFIQAYNKALQAYNKALGISSSSGLIIEQQSEEKGKGKGKARDIHPVPPTMVEVNLAEPIRSREQIKYAELVWVFLK